MQIPVKEFLKYNFFFFHLKTKLHTGSTRETTELLVHCGLWCTYEAYIHSSFWPCK